MSTQETNLKKTVGYAADDIGALQKEQAEIKRQLANLKAGYVIDDDFDDPETGGESNTTGGEVDGTPTVEIFEGLIADFWRGWECVPALRYNCSELVVG